MYTGILVKRILYATTGRLMNNKRGKSHLASDLSPKYDQTLRIWRAVSKFLLGMVKQLKMHLAFLPGFLHAMARTNSEAAAASCDSNVFNSWLRASQSGPRGWGA